MKPTGGEHAVHPAAAAFPMLGAAELEHLAADIRKNGLLYPVELVRDQVVDGRNRLAACKLAGVAPTFRDLSDTLPNDAAIVRHVVAVNVRRRHLTTSQRAAIAAELARMEHGGQRTGVKRSNDHLSQSAAGTLMNVSQKSVARAKAVMKADPVAHEAAKRGEKPKPKPKPAPITRTTSAPSAPPVTKTSAPPKPAEMRPPPVRASAPDWYNALCARVLELAHAAMKANGVPAAEVLEALDDVYGQLEDEAEGKGA